MAIISRKEYNAVRNRLRARKGFYQKKVSFNNNAQTPAEREKILKEVTAALENLPNIPEYARKTNQIKGNKPFERIKVPNNVKRAFEKARNVSTSDFAKKAADISYRVLKNTKITNDPKKLEYLDLKLRGILRGDKNRSTDKRVVRLAATMLTKVRELRGTGKGTNSNAKAYIYKITDLTTNKVYIGQTVVSPKRRFAEHLSHDRTKTDRYFQSVGRKNLKLETLKIVPRKKLDYYEAAFIKQFNSTDPNKGLNVKRGNITSVNTIRTLSQAYRKRTGVDKYAANLSVLRRKVSSKLAQRKAALSVLRGNTAKISGKVVTSSNAARIMKKFSTKRSGKRQTVFSFKVR